MTLFDQISQDIVAAMKAKDKGRLMALRNVKKLFIEAKTAPGATDELTDEAAMKIWRNSHNKDVIRQNFTCRKIVPTWPKKKWYRCLWLKSIYPNRLLKMNLRLP